MIRNRESTSVTKTEIIGKIPDMVGMRVLSVLLGTVFKTKILSQAKTEFARLKELCEEEFDSR